MRDPDGDPASGDIGERLLTIFLSPKHAPYCRTRSCSSNSENSRTPPCLWPTSAAMTSLNPSPKRLSSARSPAVGTGVSHGRAGLASQSWGVSSEGESDQVTVDSVALRCSR